MRIKYQDMKSHIPALFVSLMSLFVDNGGEGLSFSFSLAAGTWLVKIVGDIVGSAVYRIGGCKGGDTLGNFVATTVQKSCRQQIAQCVIGYLLHATIFVAHNMLLRINRVAVYSTQFCAMKHQRRAACCRQQYSYNTLGDLLPANVVCSKYM